MALYVPAARRRRRAIAVGVAGLVIGMFVGWLVGRGAAPSLADGVAEVQSEAVLLTDRLAALPARAGSADATPTTTPMPATTTDAGSSSAGTTVADVTTTGDAATTGTTTAARTVDVRAEVAAIRDDLDALVDRAPWITDRTATLLDQQLAAVGIAASRDPGVFATAVRAAVAALNLAFGLNR